MALTPSGRLRKKVTIERNRCDGIMRSEPPRIDFRIPHIGLHKKCL